MDVSIAPVAAAAAAPPARAESVATVGRQPVVASTGEGMAQARLNAVVELISNLTGREVKLVPPVSYIVSAPAGMETMAPVELDAPVGLMTKLAEQQGQLEVGTTAILRSGPSDRMLLTPNTAGALQLHNAVDLEL